MTLRDLRYLVALADKQNFTRAADSCYVGQPTLSTQLKKLEDYLDLTLFDRNNHHVRPTPIGKEIIERARVALEAVDEIRELARQAHDPLQGAVRLGVIPTLGPFLLPHLLQNLRQSFPRLRLFLREDLAATLLDALRNYELDALLLSLPVGNGDIESVSVFREPLLVALPKGHPLAAKSHIAREDLAQEKLLLLRKGHCLREQVLAVCEPPLSDPSEEVEASSLEMLRQAVAAGFGCALLPALAAASSSDRGETDALCFRPIAPPTPARTVGIAWRRGDSRSTAVRRLSRFLHANLPLGVEPLPLDGGDSESAEHL
jgi:LysR family hydrogen peroxide-inducible transcriptional activator